MATFFGSAPLFLDEPVDAIDEIVVHLAAPLLVAGIEEVFAIAGGAAEIDLQHGVAAVGEPLHGGVVAPGIAAPGSAVHQQHRRQSLEGNPRRRGQVAVNRQAIAALVGNRLHLRQHQAFELRLLAEEQRRLPGGTVVGVISDGTAVVGVSHEPGLVGQVAVGHAELRPRLDQQVEVAFDALVEDLPNLHVAIEGDCLNDAQSWDEPGPRPHRNWRSLAMTDSCQVATSTASSRCVLASWLASTYECLVVGGETQAGSPVPRLPSASPASIFPLENCGRACSCRRRRGLHGDANFELASAVQPTMLPGLLVSSVKSPLSRLRR